MRKLGRYSEKDKEDISALIKDSDKILIAKLIKIVESRDDFSERVKHEFMKNSKLLRAEYNV